MPTYLQNQHFTEERIATTSNHNIAVKSVAGGVGYEEERCVRGDERDAYDDDGTSVVPITAVARAISSHTDITSLYIVMFYTFLTVVNFIIVIPTAKQYVTLLGGNDDLVGLAIGLTPFLSGIVQIPITILMRTISIKTMLLYFCGWLGLMEIMYALSGYFNSITCLMLSRAAMGLVDGPQLITLYVVRTTVPKDRSETMHAVGVSIAAGYSIGCLLSVLITDAHKGYAQADAGTVEALGNESSIPGWLLGTLCAIEFGLIYF